MVGIMVIEMVGTKWVGYGGSSDTGCAYGGGSDTDGGDGGGSDNGRGGSHNGGGEDGGDLFIATR